MAGSGSGMPEDFTKLQNEELVRRYGNTCQAIVWSEDAFHRGFNYDQRKELGAELLRRLNGK